MKEFDRWRRRLLGGAALGGALAWFGRGWPGLSPAHAADTPPIPTPARGRPHRAVYHLDDSQRAIAAIRNLTHHREAVPTADLVLVALGDGVDFLLEGASDDRGNSYDALVDTLLMDGVRFRVCGNTLVARKIARERVLPDVTVVASGMAEIARLQLDEGFAYLKP